VGQVAGRAGEIAALLAAHDDQMRPAEAVNLPAGVHAERDGPIVRVVGQYRGFIGAAAVIDLGDDALDALIARQCDFFAARGEAVEWKTRAHDRPEDLTDRLRAAGFLPEPRETVLIGLIGRVQTGTMVVFVAEAGGEVVSTAWLVFKPGTEFAGLWGGSTLAEWRGKGIYRALVARRADLAAERGIRYLQVDASDDSRPILQRLGFVAVTTTTPYVWAPPGPAGAE
jgi:GNAT superfamily N-acetyltransferase